MSVTRSPVTPDPPFPWMVEWVHSRSVTSERLIPEALFSRMDRRDREMASESWAVIPSRFRSTADALISSETDLDILIPSPFPSKELFTIRMCRARAMDAPGPVLLMHLTPSNRIWELPSPASMPTGLDVLRVCSRVMFTDPTVRRPWAELPVRVHPVTTTLRVLIRNIPFMFPVAMIPVRFMVVAREALSVSASTLTPASSGPFPLPVILRWLTVHPWAAMRMVLPEPVPLMMVPAAGSSEEPFPTMERGTPGLMFTLSLYTPANTLITWPAEAFSTARPMVVKGWSRVPFPPSGAPPST